MSTQTPQQEMAERVAEGAPGLVMAAHAEAVQNLRRINHEARNRLADSHRWQAESLGKQATESGVEDMGNLVVCGDIYGADSAEILRSLQSIAPAPTTPQPVQQPNPSPPPASATGWPAWAKALGLAAAITGAGGLGAAATYALIQRPTSTSTSTTSTTTIQPGGSQLLGVDVIPNGAIKTE